jgi:hypothetical protein
VRWGGRASLLGVRFEGRGATAGPGRPATAGSRNYSLQTGRSDLVLNFSEVVSISPTGAPATGHMRAPATVGSRVPSNLDAAQRRRLEHTHEASGELGRHPTADARAMKP